MTLHTWNKADTTATTLMTCLALLRHGDTLLLIEDGTYAVLDEGFMQQLQAAFARGAQLCVLHEDLAARAVSARIPASVQVVGYKEFVALAVRHERIVNWI